METPKTQLKQLTEAPPSARNLRDAMTNDAGKAREKRRSTTLSVIVPAYNEQYLIEASIERLRVLEDCTLLESIKVIVVDDGSTDGTAAAIDRYRKSVEPTAPGSKFSWIWLRHANNRGKGAAIQTALDYVDTELVVIHDSDLEYHPADLPKMIEVFLFEDADAVFGSRFMSGGYRRTIFFRHALGNHLLTFLCDLVCDLNLTDIETCYKMMRSSLLKSIPLESSTFDIEPELAIKLSKRGGRIFEVPISYSGRTYLEGKKINWKDGARAFCAIVRYAISDRIYKEDETGGEILERLNRAPRFTRWMAEVIRPYMGDRVLEIGAGRGNMSVHFMPRAIYWATDINPNYLDYLLTLRATRPYMRVAYTNATDGASFPKDQSLDTVVCLNVIEHIDQDVQALRNICEHLVPDGRAIVLVPCSPALYGSLDEVLGHVRRYTKEQLAAAAVQAGFRVEQILKFNRAGVLGWWVNGRLLRKKTFDLGQIRVLNFFTPLFRILEPILPLPPLSLIAILRKEKGDESVGNARDASFEHKL